MSLIRNLIVEPENKQKGDKNRKKGDDNDEEDDNNKPRPIVKSATDLQRLRLEKLMKNPDKPIVIPESPREKDYMQTVPSFVRNVMGSSAGAGSGEFHVYRHLRRKEYARQKTIHAKSKREQMDEEYQQKLDDNRRKAEEKTAKKRAKRLKKKQRAKKPRGQDKETSEATEDGKDEETSEDDDEGEQVKADEESKVDAVATEDAAVQELTPVNDIAEKTNVPNNEQEGSKIHTDDNKETSEKSQEEHDTVQVNEAPQTSENLAENTAVEDKTQTNDIEEKGQIN